MCHVGRILLLCIMIMALPLQGIARAMTSPCTMNQTSLSTPRAAKMDACNASEMTIRVSVFDTKESIVAADKDDAASCKKRSDLPCTSCQACADYSAGAFTPPARRSLCIAGDADNESLFHPFSCFMAWLPSCIERPSRP
jgi:hypothetical protein